MPRERVFDWKGGPLKIFRVLEGPTGPLHRELVEEVDCLALPHGLALPIKPVPIKTREGEPVAELEIGVVGGRPACVAIRAVGDHELTTLLLRNLSGLGKFVREFVKSEAATVVRTEDGEIVGERLLDETGFTAPTHRALSEEFLRDVADVYRAALATGQSTQEAIRERWPTSEANARRWVARAREDGYLGAAPARRRAGEQQPKKGKGKKR